MIRAGLLILILTGHCYGQVNEFKINSNGLIYDESTMSRLGAIVDSLNIRFRTCELSHPYYSYEQGMATWVEIPNKTALALIKNGTSVEEYSKRYPGNVKRKDLWVTKSHYSDYKDIKRIVYSGLGDGPSVEVKKKTINDKTTGWVIDEEEDEAFYLKDLKARNCRLIMQD